MGRAGHVTGFEEMRRTRKILVGRPEGKRQLGSPRSRWEDNIKIDLKDADWIEVSNDTAEWHALVQHGNEPWAA
jgi:hypothetical protein